MLFNVISSYLFGNRNAEIEPKGKKHKSHSQHVLDLERGEEKRYSKRIKANTVSEPEINRPSIKIAKRATQHTEVTTMDDNPGVIDQGLDTPEISDMEPDTKPVPNIAQRYYFYTQKQQDTIARLFNIKYLPGRDSRLSRYFYIAFNQRIGSWGVFADRTIYYDKLTQKFYIEDGVKQLLPLENWISDRSIAEDRDKFEESEENSPFHFLFEYTGELISNEEAQIRDETDAQSTKYFFDDPNTGAVIDAFRAGGAARFINGSYANNIEFNCFIDKKTMLKRVGVKIVDSVFRDHELLTIYGQSFYLDNAVVLNPWRNQLNIEAEFQVNRQYYAKLAVVLTPISRKALGFAKNSEIFVPNLERFYKYYVKSSGALVVKPLDVDLLNLPIIQINPDGAFHRSQPCPTLLILYCFLGMAREVAQLVSLNANPDMQSQGGQNPSIMAINSEMNDAQTLVILEILDKTGVNHLAADLKDEICAHHAIRVASMKPKSAHFIVTQTLKLPFYVHENVDGHCLLKTAIKHNHFHLWKMLFDSLTSQQKDEFIADLNSTANVGLVKEMLETASASISKQFLQAFSSYKKKATSIEEEQKSSASKLMSAAVVCGSLEPKTGSIPKGPDKRSIVKEDTDDVKDFYRTKMPTLYSSLASRSRFQNANKPTSQGGRQTSPKIRATGPR